MLILLIITILIKQKGEIISLKRQQSFFKNTTTYNGLWNGDSSEYQNNNFSNQRTKTI